MAKNLVIVESPAKSKTLKKYLGKDFDVLACYGHVRDLIPKEGAVDVENDFAMQYKIVEKSSKHFAEIAKKTRLAENLYLATDPDREGEAISWHLSEMLAEKKLLKNVNTQRIVFHEITKSAVQNAVANPRSLSIELIDAQQARRALDYLVGFNLSPLLWKKVRRGLSAGRVQSPALRLIVERQQEIDAFVAREYWTMEADLNARRRNFVAKLFTYQGKKVTQFFVTNKEKAEEIKQVLQQAAPDNKLQVIEVKKSKRKRNPAAPFITSTLQQEAVRKLGFSAQKTMRVAQQLYEGIDTGEGESGLITYMRTDSVHLAQDAIDEIRKYIVEKFDKKSLPKEVRVFKTKAKNAQEAHEAIRPTSVYKEPQAIKQFLSPDQFKLYNLIWKRTLACQMQHATLNSVSLDLACGEGNVFRATGSTIADPGFMALYLEGVDDNADSDKTEKILPDLEKGDYVDLKALRGEQHFTEPPPKFTEASLVKSLEEFGIGRPSTYASIISTLQQRGYVLVERKRFEPTDVGKIVNKFLTAYFANYVDYNFTANLEDSLDAIARGEKQLVPILREFWDPFINLVKDTEKNVQRKDVTHEELDETCPQCNEHKLAIRLGKRGRFIGCNGYPDCDYTRALEHDAQAAEEEKQIVSDRKCPKCESDLIIRPGKYGKFIGCSAYPKCKHIEPLEAPEDTNVSCPECKEGSLIKRKSRFGTYFYSCNSYPKCKYAISHPPLAENCPECKWPVMMLKTTKRWGRQKVCPQKECKFTENLPIEE